MIDLSFLTEEEQEAIMKVLQRDADLKKAEEERVRVLEETVDDTNELKNKTGQWFYEAKSKRHRDKIHGADLIRASIRKKKPQTIAELSQSRTDKAKKSWVNNVNKDIFIPPELFGVMEEPEKEEEEEMRHAQYYRSVPRVDNLSLDETDASFQKAVSSPSKQRRNPFNDAALDDDFLLTSENRLSENGSPRFQQIPGKGIMPPSRKSQSSKTFPKSESKEASQTSSDAVDGSDRHGEQIPKPKVRTVTYKIVDPQSDNDSSFPKPTKRTDSMNGTSARKGILKRSPSSSSTDSEILRISQTFDSQSKSVLPTTPIIEGEAEKNYVDDIPDESSQYSTDRLKQVRFTSADVQDELPLSPDTHKGKEIGEFHLLESDFGKNAMDNIDGFQYLHSEHGSTENGMPVHPETIDLDGDVAVTVSEEEDGDATPYQSLSSSGDHNLIADVLQLEQTPSSSTIRIDSQSSTYELSQEKGSPPAVTTVRPPKEISVNINENGMPASELLIESDSTDLSNPELQPSKLTVDQQPIYATVKSPRVSKLDSSDIQQDQQPLHTEVKSPQVSNNNSTNHHEGKPSHVGDLSPDTPSKPDKYTIEFKKAADESISKVLAWFNRDSVTSGEKTNSINAPEKVFIEERDPSRKTETRAIVPENARPSAAELRLKSPIQERQTPSQSKHAKHFTSDAGTQCRKELLSFGIDKNIGGKSGNVDVHGDVDTENKVLEHKTLLQRAENRFKDSSGEQLLYGKSKSGGGKMCFGAESPASKIPEAKLSTETVPTSHKKSEAERNLKSVNSSEINIEESLLENNANRVLGDKMPEDDFASPVAVRTDTEEIPKTEPRVPGVEDLQQDTMVYWKRPSILEQKEPMQQPKTLVDVESSGKKRLSDMKSLWEGDKAAARAPSAKPTFKESNKINTLNTGLENIQVETKEEIKHQNEVPRSNITAVKSLWEDKANLAKPLPYKLTSGTGDKATKKQASSEKKSRVLLQSPKAEDLKQKELVDSIKNPDKLNAHDNFLGKDQSLDSQQKHNFKVLSFKERMHESPTEQLSNPAQFQSLRSFWNIEKKSPDKPEIKPYVGRRGTTLHDSKDSEFLELDKAVAQNTQDGFQAQDKKLSDFEESDYKRKEWRKKEAQGNKTVPDSLMQVHASLSRDGIAETVEKVSAPSKSEIDTFEISLERLGKEASENQPASEREHVEEEKALRKAEVCALNTGLQKFGRETPETLMPLNQKILATESSANDTRPGQGSFFERVRQRTNNDSQYYQKTKATQPQEVRETVEKAIAPRKTDSSEFKIGFEKLVKEASDVPSPFHQTADISEIVKNSGSTSKHFKQPDEKAPPQEIQETIEKSAVPPKSDQNEFNVGLQKLLIEASVASPQSPETARNEDSIQKSIRPKQQSVFESVKYGRINDSPGAPKVQNHQEEVQEMVSKMAAPEKVEFSAFNSGLEKLYKEASECSPASYVTTDAKEDIHTNISDQDQQSFYKGRKNLHETTGVSQNRMASPKEIKQSENASVASPEIARNEDSVQQNVSRPEHLIVFESVNYGRLNDSPGAPTAQYHQEEVEEMVSKMAAPEKVEFIAFNSGLEKLYREASEFSPTSYVTADTKEDIHTNVSVQGQQLFNKGRKNLHETDSVSKNRMTSPREVTKQSGKASQPEQPVLSFQKVTPEQVSFATQKGQFPPEVNEIVDKTVSLPKTETSAFNVGLEKLYQEALDSSEPNKVGPVQNLSSQPEQEILSADLPISIIYNSDVKVLVKKETSRQTDLEKHKEETSRDAYLAKESPFPEAPDRNIVFLQKTIHKSGPSASNPLPFGDENNSMSKTYRVKNVEHPRNEVSEVEVVADLVDDHEYAAPDVNASGRFVRASTPVKERDSSVKSSAIERSVSSPRHENEDLSKSTDSDFSDGNTGPYAGSWRNSSRSEEELNPVLTALKRSSSKPMPSKSLEDISSASSKPRQVDLPREECVLSKEDDQKADQREPFYETIPGNSTVPSYRDNRFSDAEKMKRLSKSVPDFLQDDSDDRETDSTSEGSFQLSRHRKTPSSLTNLSGSSGMASLSSVSGSVMSIYSGDFGNVDIKGNIQFTIDYVDQLQEFHIFVSQCKDLAVADVKKQRSDPYVKSYLLPDKEKLGKRKTAVRKKTLNPAYNEILRYKISKQTLLTQKLNLSVWHHDTFGRNSFLGEVAVDLATFDWNKQMSWYSLQPRTPAAGIGLENRGEINIALMYTSKPTSGKNTASSGEVHIWVKSCSNLPMLRGNRINSFVKCTVLPDTSRKSRQKTRSVDKTVNPVFNHTMVYDGFRPEDLREACVELTVWDHNRLVNHFLGGLRLGFGSGKSYGTPVDWMDSTSYEASLWKKMINTPDEWVQDTLQLRMLMMAKMAK